MKKLMLIHQLFYLLKGSNKKDRIATLSVYKSAVKKQRVFNIRCERINLHPILLWRFLQRNELLPIAVLPS